MPVARLGSQRRNLLREDYGMNRFAARVSAVALIAAASALPARAEPLPTTHYLPLPVAIEAATAARGSSFSLSNRSFTSELMPDRPNSPAR